MNNLDAPYLSYLPRIHNCAGKPSRTLSGHVARVIALRLDLDTGANQLPGSIQVHTRRRTCLLKPGTFAWFVTRVVRAQGFVLLTQLNTNSPLKCSKPSATFFPNFLISENLCSGSALTLILPLLLSSVYPCLSPACDYQSYTRWAQWQAHTC